MDEQQHFYRYERCAHKSKRGVDSTLINSPLDASNPCPTEVSQNAKPLGATVKSAHVAASALVSAPESTPAASKPPNPTAIARRESNAVPESELLELELQLASGSDAAEAKARRLASTAGLASDELGTRRNDRKQLTELGIVAIAVQFGGQAVKHATPRDPTIGKTCEC